MQWDAPNLMAFRFEWFLEHLDWRVEHESNDPHVHIYKSQLQQNILQPVDIELALKHDATIMLNEDGTYLLSG